MIYSGVEEDFFNSNIVVGYGKSHASFGELVQGRLSNQSDFLVTLPIDMWSICHLTCIKRKGPLLINSHYEKSKWLPSSY